MDNYGHKYGQALSNSMLQTLLKCPHQFVKKYIEKVKEPGGYRVGGHTAGSIVHEAIDFGCSIWQTKTMKSLIPSIPNREQIRDLLLETIESHKKTNEYGSKWRTTPYSAPEMTNYWKKTFQSLAIRRAHVLETMTFEDITFDKDLFDVLSTAAKSYNQYIKWVQDGTIPQRPYRQDEQLFFMPYEGLSICGTVDCLPNDRPSILDYKTGKGFYGPEVLRNSDQFHLYALLVEHNLGTKMTHIEVAQLTTGEFTKFEITEDSINRFKDRFEATINYYHFIMERIQNNNRIPKAAEFTFGCPCPFALESAGEHRCPSIHVEKL